MKKYNDNVNETIIQVEDDKYHIQGDNWNGYYTKEQLKNWYLKVRARVIELLNKK